ncbi:MAG: hypothetical protein H7A46_23170 [Verrucomicrobiales bacterium]|nr:hypothetical protein [Verrucomicrobiales bacterium]
MNPASHHSETPFQRAARRRRRRKRALLLVGAFLALLMLGTVWGWRYGYTRLPEPVTEVRLPEVKAVEWIHLPPGCAWEPVWRMAVQPGLKPWLEDSQELLELLSSAWMRTGVLRGNVVAGLDKWMADGGEIERCFDGFLDAPRPPLPGEVPHSVEAVLRLLRLAPLARAMLACPTQTVPARPEEALSQLIRGFRFYARLTPPREFAGVFDERGPREVDATLGRTFRRVVINGPTLDPATGRALLGALIEVTNDVAPFEQVQAMRVRQARARRDADHQRVVTGLGRTLTLSASLFWHDTREMPQRIGRWWGGAEAGFPEFQGRRYLRGMLAALADWGQEKLAREQDFERIWQFRISQLQARPHDAELARLPLRPDGWFSWFDRPAVWESTGEVPFPETILNETGDFLATVEVCRLTLALRLYRDRAGDWPESLEQLVPDWLPGVPVDPFLRVPFGYRRDGGGWSLSAGSGTAFGLSCTSHP